MPQDNQDSFNLKRFITAQNNCYLSVRKELTQGKKAFALDMVYLSAN